LIAVQLPDGRLIEYVTDGRNRRIGKMVNGVLVKQWLYRDQLKPVAELDGSGNLVAEFIYGTKANVPDLVIRGGVTYRTVSDQLGSPVLAVNSGSSSDVPFQANYAAFGDRMLVAGTDDWMPFGFAGGIYDPDTKLTRFGARDFEPIIGRWVSKDPIRFAAGQGNIYEYVESDPIDRSDPEGRGDWEFCSHTGANELDYCFSKCEAKYPSSGNAICDWLTSFFFDGDNPARKAECYTSQTRFIDHCLHPSNDVDQPSWRCSEGSGCYAQQ
jgi:RHS repeat-associated protein